MQGYEDDEDFECYEKDDHWSMPKYLWGVFYMNDFEGDANIFKCNDDYENHCKKDEL